MAQNRVPENPYLAARQEWTERYGSYVRAAAAWRIVGILGLTMAVIGFGYAMYLSTQAKLVPYVVSGGQNRIVNYRMKNDMMVVDYAVDKAILVSGVGWRQQKITIRRGA